MQHSEAGGCPVGKSGVMELRVHGAALLEINLTLNKCPKFNLIS